MRKNVQAYLNEKSEFVRDKILEEIAKSSRKEDLPKIIQILEEDPEATEWDKILLLDALAQRFASEIKNYALSLRKKAQDPDAIEVLEEILNKTVL